MLSGFSVNTEFLQAVPVWEEGTEREMNRSLIFRYIISGNEETEIYIAAHSRYQIFVDGVFFAAGPARTAQGFFRVDRYRLKKELSEKRSVISVICAGYNVNSYYITDQPSFLCCEIKRGGEVLCATGKKGFDAVVYNSRVQRVQRFSFQRPFTESYIYDAYYDGFMTDPDCFYKPVKLKKTEDKKFIERNSPYCENRYIRAERIISKGIMVPEKSPEVFSDRSCDSIGKTLKGYKKEELEGSPIDEVKSYRTQILETDAYGMESVPLGINCCALYDMGADYSGYIRLSLTAEHDTVIYAVFGEKLNKDGIPEPGELKCANVIRWAVQGGRPYDFTTFEPYTFRYIQIISMYAPTLISNVALFEEAFPESELTELKNFTDPELKKIYSAAVLTFRANACDIFTDCPGRERAGRLCDSWFTGRTEHCLTGKNRVEHDFLENFIMAENFPGLPEGMLPMCWPADHYDGTYIRNRALWFVFELKSYLDESRDRELIDKARDKVYKLFDFCRKTENSDGLTEDDTGWVFIEWSEANNFTAGVNYPSNMLYALALETAGELYDDSSLINKAKKIKEVIREQSFDGKFFCDHAVRDKDGRLIRCPDITETCQYYAFFTGTADKEKYPGLYKTMLEDFGAVRKKKNKYPGIYFSNAFTGNFLRLEILRRDRQYELMKSEIKDFFLTMAEKTGTLWENMTECASCCHGFAGYTAVLLSESDKKI